MLRALDRAGSNIPINNAIIDITTSNSINVNALRMIRTPVMIVWIYDTMP